MKCWISSLSCNKQQQQYNNKISHPIKKMHHPQHHHLHPRKHHHHHHLLPSLTSQNNNTTITHHQPSLPSSNASNHPHHHCTRKDKDSDTPTVNDHAHSHSQSQSPKGHQESHSSDAVALTPAKKQPHMMSIKGTDIIREHDTNRPSIIHSTDFAVAPCILDSILDATPPAEHEELLKWIGMKLVDEVQDLRREWHMLISIRDEYRCETESVCFFFFQMSFFMVLRFSNSLFFLSHFLVWVVGLLDILQS